MRDLVIVLDFDHDTSRTVARMLRAERVNCKILPGDTAAEKVFAHHPQGIVLSAASGNDCTVDAELMENTVPILALGGMSCAMVRALQGHTEKDHEMHGLNTLTWGDCPLFAGIDETERMLQNVCYWELPPILSATLKAGTTPLGFMHMVRPYYGLQLEMDPNAPEDAQILRNFAVEVCSCEEEWTELSFVENAVETIRNCVGEKRVLGCVSGGLDSALSAVLAQSALGDRMQCLFINNGFLRQGEAEQFLELCKHELELNVVCVNAEKRFMDVLQGVSDKAEKRRIIQNTMRSVVDEWAEKLGPFDYFVKGTNCSDKMYSDGATSFVPGSMKTLEPLEDLFKPEIKQVAAAVGMPDWFVRQQPFPSGGLAVRILGAVDEDKMECLRFADHAFGRELSNAGVAKKLYKYFAMLLSDEAENAWTVVLRALQSGEGAVAPAARVPYDVIETVTERILQENRQVAHVVYDMTPGNYYADAEW